MTSRIKDLVDIGLLARHFHFDATTLRASIEATFEFRDTHSLPTRLPPPPPFWEGLYEDVQQEDQLPWDNLEALQRKCEEFLNPLLQDTTKPDAKWLSEQWE